MKRIFVFAFTLLAGILAVSCSSLNTTKLTNAGMGAVTAFTLTDTQVAELSLKSVEALDVASQLAPANNAYTVRLNRLTANMTDVNGIPLNYKVYLTPEINAFATADGSIRVYSGLMDIMTDAELVAIIGHEIGHVAHADSKNALRNAYLAYAAREALGATSDKIAALTDSQLGDLAVMYVEAQFSQKQEYAADEIGFQVSVDQGYSPYSMSSALQKLVDASGGSQASLIANMFSSHPDSAARAARMKQKADEYKK